MACSLIILNENIIDTRKNEILLGHMHTNVENHVLGIHAFFFPKRKNLKALLTATSTQNCDCKRSQ